MRLEILLLGRTREPYLQQGIDDYLARLRKFTPVELIEIKLKKSGARNDEEIKAIESGLLENRVAAAGYRVALDRRGRQFSSTGLAEFLTGLELRPVPTVSFLIGGPLGLADQQLGRADQVMALSEMTFPHDLVRLILLEQLYRAYTIKAGTGYHK